MMQRGICRPLCINRAASDLRVSDAKPPHATWSLTVLCSLPHPHAQATDVYSFGVLLWQMQTGSQPWPGMRKWDVVQAVVAGRCLVFPQDTPDDISNVGRACLHPDAAHRPTFSQIKAHVMAALDRIELEVQAAYVGSFTS